jgi:hypothetical protein
MPVVSPSQVTASVPSQTMVSTPQGPQGSPGSASRVASPPQASSVTGA